MILFIRIFRYYVIIMFFLKKYGFELIEKILVKIYLNIYFRCMNWLLDVLRWLY